MSDCYLRSIEGKSFDLFLREGVCGGFLACPSLIHLSSIAALTLGLLAGSGSSRDNTNATAPEA